MKMKIQYVMRSLVASVATFALAATGSAQLITEWNFNALPPNATAASTGTGTSAGFFFPFLSAFPLSNGSPNDTNPFDMPAGPNNASGARGGPISGSAPGAAVVTFRTSTAGYSAPALTWDFLQGFRASRYYQLELSSDGTNFAAPAGGTGSSISGPFGTASIDSSGLITIETVDGLIDAGDGVGYMHDLSYALPSGTAFDNNADFAFRIFATWDPSGSDYVSSFAGTTEAADAVSGYIRTASAGGGQIRYDLVRVSGTVIPEPTSIALGAVLSLALVGGRRRRR
jgi:hypothetical protein